MNFVIPWSWGPLVEAVEALRKPCEEVCPCCIWRNDVVIPLQTEEYPGNPAHIMNNDSSTIGNMRPIHQLKNHLVQRDIG